MDVEEEEVAPRDMKRRCLAVADEAIDVYGGGAVAEEEPVQAMPVEREARPGKRRDNGELCTGAAERDAVQWHFEMGADWYMTQRIAPTASCGVAAGALYVHNATGRPLLVMAKEANTEAAPEEPESEPHYVIFSQSTDGQRARYSATRARDVELITHHLQIVLEAYATLGPLPSGPEARAATQVFLAQLGMVTQEEPMRRQPARRARRRPGEAGYMT